MIKLLKNLKRKDLLVIFIVFILIFVQVWLELKMPDYMSKITTLIMTDGTKVIDVLKEGGFMLACAFGSLLSSIFVGYLVANVTAKFSKKVREKLYDKVVSFNMGEIKNFSTSSLITRTTNDITNVQMFIAMGLQLMIKSPIMAIWAITKIIDKGFEWSIATAIAVLFMLVLGVILVIIVLPRFKKVQKLIDKLNNVTREGISGIRVIHAFNAENYQENKFNDTNNELTGLQLFTQRTLAIMTPSMFLTMNMLTLAIYFIGALLINAADLVVKIELFSNMVVFTSYALQVIMSFLMLAVIFIMLPRAQISAHRINEVLDTEPTIKDGDVTDSPKDGVVEFNHVSFKYPDADEYILKDINFSCKKGETVAFIGSTGSGKSTLINLIPRFYDVTNGDIYIDGVNVKDYKLSALHDKIGYVPQKAVMLSGTVSYNIKYGDKKNYEVTDKKVNEAIDMACASEFVDTMDGQTDAHIASGGTNVSGGQKQRLAIARAIARDPEIFIFDDSFSALDYKTDFKLRKNLKKNCKDSTVFIVAQRIGTIMDADKIIVLDKGECKGIGTHKELMKNCDVYREIAYSQLSKEELENE